MKMVDVVELRAGLRSLTLVPLPMGWAVEVAEALVTVQEKAAIYDKLQGELFRKYGDKHETVPGRYTLRPDTMDEALEQLKELNETEVDLSVKLSFGFAQLAEKLPDARLDPATLVRLRPYMGAAPAKPRRKS